MVLRFAADLSLLVQVAYRWQAYVFSELRHSCVDITKLVSLICGSGPSWFIAFRFGKEFRFTSSKVDSHHMYISLIRHR